MDSLSDILVQNSFLFFLGSLVLDLFYLINLELNKALRCLFKGLYCLNRFVTRFFF